MKILIMKKENRGGKRYGSGRKKGLPTKVKRIYISIEPAVDDLMKKEVYKHKNKER